MDNIVPSDQAVLFHPIYIVSMITAFALFFLFPVTKQFTDAREKTQYYYLQLIMLLGAVFGAKLAVLMGDALWPLRPFDQWQALLLSGRSIVGALLFGFVFSELAKPVIGYKRPPNDRFAVLVPFAIAIGRVGCWFSGCCLGVPLDHAESRLHPIALYEIAFHLTLGVALVALLRTGRCRGQLFAIFMIAYGLFRFVCEPLRETEKAFYGLSAYQWFAAALFLCGWISFWARSRGAFLPAGYLSQERP